MVSRIGNGSAPQPVQTSYDNAPIANERAVVEVQPVKESVQQSSQETPYELTKHEAKQLTEGLNTFLESVNVQLRFQYHDKLHEYYVTIVDSETDEVVREIPPKKLLDMHAAMKDFIGLLVDHKI
ncbi:flagellar protein FlaG [Sporosarcina sp. PTS2304]|uniref:flagellar protein FlaG n=1 Tax=Sporosarcina sp. PTS2304 TaxID=2283194 RepID=UPI000E0D1FB9|nr:flagellar protein FlaG [Sporosarcina sp. PTS2304]AXH98475.1 flagellar protein FlaG [Sporosarcina sp. PTS2304]